MICNSYLRKTYFPNVKYSPLILKSNIEKNISQLVDLVLILNKI